MDEVEEGEDDEESEETEGEEPASKTSLLAKDRPVKVNTGNQAESGNKDKNGEFAVNQNQFKYLGKKVIPIPLNLLEKDRGTPGVGDIKANSGKLSLEVRAWRATF